MFYVDTVRAFRDRRYEFKGESGEIVKLSITSPLKMIFIKKIIVSQMLVLFNRKAEMVPDGMAYCLTVAVLNPTYIVENCVLFFNSLVLYE